MPAPSPPVRRSAAGSWFLPGDGGAGSLLRLADGITAGAVRRVRDLGMAGLMPIGNVVAEHGRVWLRTPQPPGPALDDLLGVRLGAADAVAVLGAVVRVLLGVHARGLTHGGIDGAAVLLDPDGEPVVVMVEGGTGGPERDEAEVAGLAWVLAEAWCARDPAAGLLRHWGDLAERAGLAAAQAALPAAGPPGGLRRVARERAALLGMLPAPRSGVDGAERRTTR